MFAMLHRLVRARGPKTAVLLGLAAGLLASCASERPPERVRHESHPTGNLYAGWRVFQDRCARCHGEQATGTALAPDLLPRVAGMGERRFAQWVLLRYDWGMPPGHANADAAVRASAVDDVLARREPAVTMPAWQGEPQVNAHIADLYTYLAARAEGTQGPGKPAR